MATTNDSGNKTTVARRQPRYPWHEWFGSEQFLLVRGKDFVGRIDSMMQQVRQRASLLGVSVRITAADDGSWARVKVIQRKGGKP